MEKELNIIKITGDENTYKVIDADARTKANEAVNIANSKLKSATLKGSYEESSKTLTLSVMSSTR